MSRLKHLAVILIYIMLVASITYFAIRSTIRALVEEEIFPTWELSLIAFSAFMGIGIVGLAVRRYIANSSRDKKSRRNLTIIFVLTTLIALVLFLLGVNYL